MKEYIASIRIDNELQTITFTVEDDSSPVEYLWQRYGMSTYIEYVEELTTEQ